MRRQYRVKSFLFHFKALCLGHDQSILLSFGLRFGVLFMLWFQFVLTVYSRQHKSSSLMNMYVMFSARRSAPIGQTVSLSSLVGRARCSQLQDGAAGLVKYGRGMAAVEWQPTSHSPLHVSQQLFVCCNKNIKILSLNVL